MRHSWGDIQLEALSLSHVMVICTFAPGRSCQPSALASPPTSSYGSIHSRCENYPKLGSMYTKDQRNRHLWIIALLSVLTFALISVFNRGALNLAGEYVDHKGVNTAALRTLAFTIPLLGFILGTLVALIPHKEMTYRQKYLRASLLTIIVIDSLMLANTIFINLLA